MMERKVSYAFNKPRLFTFRAGLGGSRIPVYIPVIEVTDDTPVAIVFLCNEPENVVQILVVLIRVNRWGRTTVMAAK